MNPNNYQYILPSNTFYRSSWQHDEKIIQNYSICYDVPPVHATFFAMMDPHTPIRLSLIDEDGMSPEDLLKRWATITHGAFDVEWYGNMWGLQDDMSEEDAVRRALVSLVQSEPERNVYYVGAVLINMQNELVLVVGQYSNLGSYGLVTFHPIYPVKDNIRLRATPWQPWQTVESIDVLAQAVDDNLSTAVSVCEYIYPAACGVCRDVSFGGYSPNADEAAGNSSAMYKDRRSPAPLADVSGIHLPESFYAELDEVYAPRPEDL